MRKLIKECAPWLNWKVTAVFVAVVACLGLIVGVDAGVLAIAGATPLLAIALCLVPCLIPLVLLRSKKGTAQNTASTTGGCNCGSDACSVGTGADSCQTQIALVTEKHQ
jgi:hypothetical protein